jgi:PAS domain S-box-containing protein
VANSINPGSVRRPFLARSHGSQHTVSPFPEGISHAIVESACVGASDAQRRVLLWNQKAKETFGWSKAEAQGQRLDELLKFKLDRPMEEVVSNVLRDGHWRGEMLARHKDGHEINLMADWKLVSDDRGEPILLLWYADISRLKSAQEKIATHSLSIHQFSTRLAAALDEERARIAREFHDQLGQVLTAAKLNLYQASVTLQPGAAGKKLREQLKNAISAMDTASRMTQKLCMELRPTVLDDASLAEAIRWHARQIKGWTKGRLKLEVDPNLRIDREASMALFRILQEALNNIVRHAKAKEVRVSLTRNKKHAQMTIRDNGRGMDMQKMGIDSSLGLLGMRERAAAVGGDVQIRSEPGRGTTVTARVPL